MSAQRLIGTGPDQISLNGMLGTMAFVNLDNVPQLEFTYTAAPQNIEALDSTNLGPVYLASISALESGQIASVDADIAGAPLAITLNGLNYWRAYYSVIAEADLRLAVGTDANDIPVAGMLGRLAFVDEWCGYAQGGGAVTQATNKSTGVTLNTPCGQITLNGAQLAANTAVAFTLTNSQIASQDVVAVSIKSGATAGAYAVSTLDIASGSVKIVLRNLTAGALSEAVVLNFVIIKSTTTTA